MMEREKLRPWTSTLLGEDGMMGGHRAISDFTEEGAILIEEQVVATKIVLLMRSLLFWWESSQLHTYLYTEHLSSRRSRIVLYRGSDLEMLSRKSSAPARSFRDADSSLPSTSAISSS